MRYLLDTNVLKELSRSKPHEHVAAWLDSVDDQDLAISAITVREISKGIEKRRTCGDNHLADTLSAAADRIFAAYSGRILPIDEAVARVWGAALGQSDKHVDDSGIAATAQVHGLVVVTRNETDFQGRRVAILNPFKKLPKRIDR